MFPRFNKVFKIILSLVEGRYTYGWCPVCEHNAIFVKNSPWFRDNYICIICRSVPRNRALCLVMREIYPNYERLIIHESSPVGSTFKKFNKYCRYYSSSQYYPEIPSGEYINGIRCENIERMSFPDECIDLFITQDVFEHVVHPNKAFKEIQRVLKPGGAHIFSIPLYKRKTTIIRAKEESGTLKYLLPQIYHLNPIDRNGSLVVREWGYDISNYIHDCSGMHTCIYLPKNKYMGLDAEFLDILVSKKS